MKSVVLGVGGLLGHDGNVALFVGGRLVAASQEERYTRRKHEAAFPRLAVLDCLEIAGLGPADVQMCVLSEKPLQSLIFDRVGKPTNPLTWMLSRVVSAAKFEYPREARKLLPNAELKYAWHRHPVPRELKGLRERLDFKRCDVPSIIHVDYSARLQTVSQEVHPDFHQLIGEFKKLTGVPIIINTSFNVSGQPIVRTAEEGWHCFRHTDMDFLVISDTMYRNPNDRSREEKVTWLKQFEKSS